MTRVVIWYLLLLPLIIATGVILWQGVPDALYDGGAALIEITTRANNKKQLIIFYV